MKNHKPTHLTCSYHTAGLIFIIIGTIFVLTGCAQLYKILGLTEQQTQDQLAQDQQVTQEIIQQVRWTTHEIITTALAGAGTILSGLLARWLGTERKITAAMIGAIEHAANDTVKTAIKNHATAASVEPQLNARVRSLT